MHEFDIRNDQTRPVICVKNNDENSWFPGKENSKLLTVGEVYTVVYVDVHNWYTAVTLKELPGFQFNSVLFEEIDEEVF
jgi:hypothetical protein